MTKAELEARRCELAKEYFKERMDAFPKQWSMAVDLGYIENTIIKHFESGFDSCAALLQVEMDAKDQQIAEYENINSDYINAKRLMAHGVRQLERITYLESQLQSANERIMHLDAMVKAMWDATGKLQEQLQSANAKLAVAIKCLNEVKKDIETNATDTLWCHEGYAMTIVDRIEIDLEALTAMDASEGKGNL